MNTTTPTGSPSRLLGPTLAVGAGLALLATCRATAPEPAGVGGGAAAFRTVYAVLQHPRCVNCHPGGDAPLIGDGMQPHPQNVLRGPSGRGLYAMQCDACHQLQNTDGLHLPPGASGWHMPRPQMPLVFEGRSAPDLARQLGDPTQNGGLTPAQLLEHLTRDPLVLWGWNPGPGRTPVAVPHAEFVGAVRAWIEAGCPVPE